MEPANQFSDTEIQLAQQMRSLGLPWTPRPGQFVLDSSGLVTRASPFQDRVYFVLNYEYFTKIAGGEQRFREIMIWLPTWEQCRDVLRDLNVSDDQVISFLVDRKAFADGQERCQLYRMIVETLGQAA
jgi:hypothetical protein